MNRLRIVALTGLIALLAACGAPASPPAAAPTPAAEQAPAATAAVEQAAAPTVQAPAPTEQAPAPATGGSVTRAITSEPTGLDPAGPQGSGQNVVLPYLFDTLILQSADNTYHPLLAEKWEVSEDGKMITFTLREGITFHDGTPLDAEAVVASFERLRNPEMKSPMAASLRDVSEITAADARTVQFYFTQPSATFFSTITSPYTGIVSPSAVQELGEKFAQQPVGSGPFKLAEWAPGTAVTLERNEAYKWNAPVVKNTGAPHLDKVIFKVIPDAATQLAALRAGEVDVVFINQPDHALQLRDDPNIKLNEVSLNALTYLGFNNQKAPFDDLRVRKALAAAINKDEIVQLALGGSGTPAFAPMSPTLPGFDAGLKEYEVGFDLEAAKALLSEAGFSQGADGMWAKDGQPLKVILLTYTRAPNQEVATVIQSQLKTLGIEVEIQQMDAPTAGKAATEGQYDLLLWRYDWNDPDVLRVNLHSKRIGSSNRVFYNNPEVDTLLDQAAGEMDDAARAQLYVEAQKLIMADLPWQPLYAPVDMVAVHARVSGGVFTAMGRMVLNDAQVSE